MQALLGIMREAGWECKTEETVPQLARKNAKGETVEARIDLVL